jgi:hypothetical protein
MVIYVALKVEIFAYKISSEVMGISVLQVIS